MSSKVLSDVERDFLNLILEDLHYLFSKEEILQDEIEGVLQSLKSDEVKSYIQSLRYGSKPETALRESFIAGKSILLKFLFGEVVPEVRSNGFIDYLIKDEMGRGIALELKPLFETIAKPDKSGKPILEKIKQWKLRPEDYKEQILKYIREGVAQFVILTDLRDWYFYSRELTPRELKHFCSIDLFDFIKEYEVVGNLRDYLERKEFESIRYELDKLFLESLKTWVESLSTVEFMVDDRRKLELIIGLINKFIFVQTLDDYGVIEFNWIKKRWAHHEQMWQRKGKSMVLEKFFDELDDWFYLYYDTELFKEKILPFVKQDDENINKFYRNLQLVLGLTYMQLPSGALKGVIQYNFRYIDEDILGKAYETFLAKIRKEEGVYYTPKYITQYIAENTVGEVFDKLLAEIRSKMEKECFKETVELVSKFTSVRVLDPACGSGSFLIKAIRIIVDKYKELNRIVESAEKSCVKKNSSDLSSLHPPKEVKAKLEMIYEVKKIVGPKNDRELISRILIRHIHGNDLDKRALEVAKVNIWLEAIKLSPKEFRYDKLPAHTNYILPNLEMNLCNGDSVVGLPEEWTLNYLKSNYQEHMINLFDLRQKYLEDPVNPELVDEIKRIKNEIARKLDDEFSNYLKTGGLSLDVLRQTKPFHWALEFWYVFLNERGEVLPADQRGMDIIIGNPPYVKAKLMNDIIRDFLDATYSSATASYDVYVVFIEKSVQLLKQFGHFGFINPSKFVFTDYGVGIRKLIEEQMKINQFIDFGDSQVFDEATNYTCLLFLHKEAEKEYAFRVARTKNRAMNLADFVRNVKIKIETADEYKENDYEIFTASSTSLATDSWRLIPLGQQQLLAKIEKNNPRLKDLTYKIFQGLVITPIEVFAVSIIQQLDTFVKIRPIRPEKEDEQYIIEKELLVPILKSSDINRYFILPRDYYAIFPYKFGGRKGQEFDFQPVEESEMKSKYPKILEYLTKKRHFLETREEGRWKDSPRWYEYSRVQNFGCHSLVKIVTPGISTEADYALDENGYFIDRGSYGIILKDGVNLSYKYLCALLNSKVLDFFLKSTSPFVSGGYYSYQTKYLNKLPIKTIVDDDRLGQIENLVENISELKKASHTFFDVWREWCTRLKNDEYSLDKVLSEDLRFMREGQFTNAWTSRVTFYPTETEAREKVFESFRVIGKTDMKLITIHGFDENNKDTLICEIVFDNVDLLLHTYCSLLQALLSKARHKTLSELFAKTMIPIIKQVNKSPNEMTTNIVSKVKEEFHNWLKQNKIEDTAEENVTIDNKIDDLEIRLNSLVFRLYELTEDDVRAVLDYMKTPATCLSEILKYYRKL